jgi:hypothetical protein
MKDKKKKKQKEQDQEVSCVIGENTRLRLDPSPHGSLNSSANSTPRDH